MNNRLTLAPRPKVTLGRCEIMEHVTSEVITKNAKLTSTKAALNIYFYDTINSLDLNASYSIHRRNVESAIDSQICITAQK